MNSNFKTMMQEATRLTRMGKLGEATAAIRRALNGAPPPAPRANHGDAAAAPPDAKTDGPATWDATPSATRPDTYEVPLEREPVTDVGPAASALPVESPSPVTPQSGFSIPESQPDHHGTEDFSEGTYKHSLQTLRFKLYSPPNHVQRKLPLVVMLHGCTQDPDDFATGTRMNELGREMGFFVLYPAQANSANPSRCWNWFKPNHQQRDSGEPAMIAGATRTVMQQHDIDPSRVYIAGLSAGGAMALIVAEAYPDIFSAVGVHSGLPRGAARNVMDALSVMKRAGAVPAPLAGEADRRAVPAIIFHGDADQTVHPRNGENVLAASVASGGTRYAPAADSPHVEQGESGRGRRYTRSVYRDTAGKVHAEYWLVHGAGHAWSGGDADGSYTDNLGPNATRAMLQFFFDQSKANALN